MNKNEICKKMLENINTASKMGYVSYNPKTKESKFISFEVTDVAKNSAISAIEKFLDDDSERVLIYHGQDDSGDYFYELEIRDGKMLLTTTIDHGMQMHNHYDSVEEILYRFDELENNKPYLMTIESTSKKM